MVGVVVSDLNITLRQRQFAVVYCAKKGEKKYYPSKVIIGDFLNVSTL